MKNNFVDFIYVFLFKVNLFVIMLNNKLCIIFKYYTHTHTSLHINNIKIIKM